MSFIYHIIMSSNNSGNVQKKLEKKTVVSTSRDTAY